MVNPEGFRYSGFLNARAEANIRHCSCLKHLHSEVHTAVHNDERVYFASTHSLADNTQYENAWSVCNAWQRDSAFMGGSMLLPLEPLHSQSGQTIVLKRLGI